MTHPLLRRLESGDGDERRAACAAAAEDPAAALLAPALARTLGDPSKAVVRAASDALVAIARRGGGGVDELLRDALHSGSAAGRWGAAFTLARLEPPGPRLLPALVEALASEDGDVRWAAARILVDAGRLHGEVLALLVGLVRTSESAAVRRMATFALRSLAPDRPEAARVLLEATGDDDLRVRRAAFTALAALEAPPREVPARLVGALRSDPDAASRRLAALALGELGAACPGAFPPEAREALRAASLAAEDEDLRRAAERSLRKLEGGAPAEGGA